MIASTLRIIFGLLLTLFIPGFALTLTIFPKEINRIEKIALSCVLSIAIVMLMALFLDLALGVDTTAKNMVISLTSFSIIFFGVHIIQRKIQNKKYIDKTDFDHEHAMKQIDITLTERLKRKIKKNDDKQ